MRIDKVYIEDFKNLKKFCIDFDEDQMNTVLLGQNATGKSNLIEALVNIFKYLDLSTPTSRRFPEFNYWIKYYCHGKTIIIDYTESNYKINVEEDEKRPSFSEFFSKEGKRNFLPKYIFTYYSGVSNRLDEIFWEHQRNFYNKIIKKDFEIDELDDLRRLFYVKPIHSFFVLMAFFALERMEKKSKDFLNDVLGIEDLESVLFVLQEPIWKSKSGDPRFWNAEGLVKDFLSVLYDSSYAPILSDETIYPDFRSKGVKREKLYLYVSDKKKLKEFAAKYFDYSNQKPSNTFLFKALESTYISDMLDEVKVRVKKKKDGIVTFKELSEGEQQLLTVIGLLIFTREEESLVLLDEPDTHLNPLWKYDYLHYLKKLVKSKSKLETSVEDLEDLHEDKTTQVIINTHDPLVIGSMVKSQVRLFGKEKPVMSQEVPKDKFDELRLHALSEAIEPDIDPRGLGVAGILTSDLFGLPSTLDVDTQKLLDERNELLFLESESKLNEQQEKRLKDLYEILNSAGFSQIFKDPLYSEFVIAYQKYLRDKRDSTTGSNNETKSKAFEIVSKMMKNRA
ncbi:AAA family ATPase [uncultured Cyclobacterium sp.]|uniref:AAA family ATPase n=1 Tax=uncultured Cyclobacterium sp. TaxID=453820 RepID=UPI0030EE984D|tara:strand:+ start:3329 stop:5023 length:1695 start_codon:yes stop_codon:yes gene_type:complete